MLHRKNSQTVFGKTALSSKASLLAAVALAVAGVSSTSLRADTAATWTGANSFSNGYWANSANWNGNIIGNNGVPSGAVYDVTVPNGTVGADLSGISPTIGQLTLGNAATIYNSNGTGAGAETLTIDPSTMTTPSGSTISGTVGNAGGSLITLDIGDGHASTAATTISALLTGDVAIVVAQPTGTVTLSDTSNAYTAGTVLDAGTLSITGSTLGTGAVTFNGGTLQTTSSITDSRAIILGAGGGTIDIDGQSNRFSGNLTGVGGLTVESTSGNGVLTLTGTGNSYAGGTTIESGTLISAVGSGLGGGSAPLVIGANGTLQLNNVFQNITTLNGAGNIQLGASTLLNVTGSSPSNFGGVMSGSGSFRVAGTNTVTLSGANTYSGTTAIASGTLEFAGSTSSLTGNIADNAALAFNQTVNSSISGVISGTGSVTESGAPGTALTLSGANTYSGTTTIASGTLEFTGNTSGLGGNVTDNSALVFGQSASSSVSGAVSGTGSITEAGAAGTTLTLLGTNTFTGGTTINSGTLAISADSSLGSGGITFNGGTLQTTAALTAAQAVTLGTNGGAIDTDGQSVIFSGNLTGTGGLTVESTSGNGVLTLSGTGNTYTGNTTVNSGGTLDVTGSLYQGAASGNVLVNGGLDVANGFTVGSLTGTGALDLTNTSAPLIVTLTSIFGGTVTGDGILEASGTGITLTLNGSLTSFTGNLLAANGGNIVLGTGAGQLNSSVGLDITNNLSTSLSYGTLNGNAVNFSGGTGGTLYLTGSNGTGTLGAISMANTGSATMNTLDAGGATNTLTLAGAISGNGSAVNTLVLQDGTFVLSASNTGFTRGGLQVGSGSGTSVAQFGSVGNLPGSGVGITLDQGQLNYTGTGNVTVANMITAGGATSVLANSGSGTETLTGAITNATAGNILAFSGGTFNLNEAGSGSGTFEIGDAPSTVIVSNANAFGSGAIIVNSGSTLETNDALAGSGSVLAVNASSYTQNSGSTLKLLATGNGVNDSIALGSGTASLNGELNLIFSGFTPAAGQHYTVISTSGAVSGGFSSIVLTGAPSLMVGMGSVVSGTGEVIDLSYSAFFANTSSFNANESSLATYLNTNAVSSSTSAIIQNAMIALSSMSSQQQTQYLDELTPQAYSQLQEQSIQNDTFMAQQLFNQLQSSFDGGGFNPSGLMMLKTNDQNPFAVSMDSALASARQQARNAVAYMDNSSQLVGMPGVGPLVPNQESPLSNLSGFVLGTITVDQLQQNNTPTQHFTTGSVMAGLDYRLNRNLVIGGLFNWGYTGGTMDNVGSRQRSSSYTPGVFVGYKQGGFYADGLMSYTYNSYQINRSVTMPGSSSIATGEPDSNEYDANALVGYYLPLARGFQAGPAVGAGFTQINMSGYHETGSPFDLTVAKQHADSLRSLLGMQALYSFAPENNPLPISINFNAFWQHEFLNSSRDINASFTQLGGGNFIYNTAGPSRDSALLGLGASGYLNKQISLFVNYETQVGDHRQFAQTVMAGVAVSF